MAGSPSSPAIDKTHRKQSFVQRYLDPTDRLGEVLFGLIMVLTFTLGAGLVVQEGRDATTQMLLGILGCNIAWGLIDGGMYIIGCLFDRSRKARLLESIQKAVDEEEAMRRVEAMLDDSLEPFTSAEERTQIYRKVLRRLERVSIERTRLTKEDVYSAIACFLLVFISAIPAVLPFLVFSDRFLALRVSNGLLLAMLFAVGYRCARATHSNPWVLGFTLLLVGLLLVGIAMALGG
jgi:hypothetical protein